MAGKSTRLKSSACSLFNLEETVPMNQLPTKLDVIKAFNYRRKIMDNIKRNECEFFNSLLYFSLNVMKVSSFKDSMRFIHTIILPSPHT
jgi:hypothetical protein